MPISDLLHHFAKAADRHGIEYIVTGSVATSLYGMARMTDHIDIVAALPYGKVEAFCAEFPEPEFDCSIAAAKDAVARRFQFNIIRTDEGTKIDLIVMPDTEFDRMRLARGRVVGDKVPVRYASPEDVILKKLEFYRLGESEKHLNDIAGILAEQGEALDRDYIDKWAARFGVEEIWARILERESETP